MSHCEKTPHSKINVLKSLGIETNEKKWHMGWNGANFYIRHTSNNGQCPKRLSTTVNSHYKMASLA